VKPGIGIEPARDGDMITSAGDTILGADDKAGITIILSVIRELLKDDGPRGDIQLLFTIAEETGLNGAKNVDYEVLDVDFGLILDGGRTAGQVVTAAPSAMSMTYTVFGKAAHAGVCPEEGVNAIQACAAGIAAMEIGRIDDETTANIGLIEGGEATNIVAPRCTARGEARSHDEKKLAARVEHMRQAMQEACQSAGATVEIEESRSYTTFSFGDDHPLVRAALQAAENLGFEGETLKGGGGSDANIFNAHGIPSIILATGTRDPHTLDESLNVAVMEECARWLRQTMDVLWENA
ncbi:MAG: M20/M25/M40 family metallo-hydrolase, partial [Armatimonadota bacterium]